MLRNIKIGMAFCGTAYHGFQRQNNSVAVQNVVEDVLSRLTAQRVQINGCSRTDAGVHAREFYFNFHTDSAILCENIIRGGNSLLPDDIVFFSCEEAEADFHARYSCKGKEYLYRIINRRVRDPFLAGKALFYDRPLDAGLLSREAKCMEGTQDFTSFCGALGMKEDCTRTVYSCTVVRDGDEVDLLISGDGFLYNMVRIITGTLLEVNEGRIPRGDIPRIIAARDRTLAGRTVPPDGLYLNRVMY